MKRKGRAPDDRVSPELARYVFERDHACVVGALVYAGELDFRLVGSCRSRSGRNVGILMRVDPSLFDELLTIAHVRDSRGGRLGRRPKSVPRRLAAVCAGHALPPDNIVDRADVRPVVDRYLEDLEGPDVDETRPWETVRRVRASGGTDRLSGGRGSDPVASESEGGRA